jgi:hypothetical protein
MICSRCGTAAASGRPRHSLDSRGRDCLRYACPGCGYSWIVPMPRQTLLEALADLPDGLPIGVRPFGLDRLGE